MRGQRHGEEWSASTGPWYPELEVRAEKRRCLGLACMWSAFPVPAKVFAQAFADSTDQSSAAVARSTANQPLVSPAGQACGEAPASGFILPGCAGRRVIRLQVNGEGGAFAGHDGDRNRGNSSDSRFLTGTAAQQGQGKHDGGVAERWSSLPGWRQSWWQCYAKAIVGTPPCGAARADRSARCSCSLCSCWTSVGSRGGAECACC